MIIKHFYETTPDKTVQHFKQHVSIPDETLQYFKQIDNQRFAKMYPDVSFNDKWVLGIKATAYFPYNHSKIECRIRLHQANGKTISIMNMKARRLFGPHHYTACMRKGRKLCDYGIMLPFDSFDELSQITFLTVVWTFSDAIQTDDGPYNFCSVQKVPLSFARGENKRCYSLTISAPMICPTIFIAESEEDEAEEEYKKAEEYGGYEDIILLFPPEKNTAQLFYPVVFLGNPPPLAPFVFWTQIEGALEGRFYADCCAYTNQELIGKETLMV